MSKPRSPFAALEGLRAQLPPGEAVRPEEAPAPRDTPLVGKLVLREERKGRGGKTVTVLSGVAGEHAAREELARAMKKALGCAATLEGESVVLHGAVLERAAAWLTEQGATKIVRGT